MGALSKRVVNVIFTATVGCAALLGIVDRAIAAPIDPMVTSEQLRGDISFMRHTVALEHPALAFSTDPATVERAYQQLASAAPTVMTRDQAWLYLATLNPLFADAHLFVGYPQWRADVLDHLNTGGTLFPYEVELRNGSVVISALLGGAETALRGARVTTVNGEAIGELTSTLTSSYRTGSHYTKTVTEANADPGEHVGDVVTGSITTWHRPAQDNPLRFRGRTQVVIGPGTYSSAVLFANVMHDFGFGTLVGRGGAARRTQSGGVRQFILPHSRLVLWVPCFVLEPPAGAVAGALLQASSPFGDGAGQAKLVIN